MISSTLTCLYFDETVVFASHLSLVSRELSCRRSDILLALRTALVLIVRRMSVGNFFVPSGLKLEYLHVTDAASLLLALYFAFTELMRAVFGSAVHSYDILLYASATWLLLEASVRGKGLVFELREVYIFSLVDINKVKGLRV